MADETYHERAMALSTICGAQAALLALFDKSCDYVTLLEHIVPLATKAVRKERERNLRKLRKLTEDLERRIQGFEVQALNAADSQRAKDYLELIEEKKREYAHLSLS